MSSIERAIEIELLDRATPNSNVGVEIVLKPISDELSSFDEALDVLVISPQAEEMATLSIRVSSGEESRAVALLKLTRI